MIMNNILEVLKMKKIAVHAHRGASAYAPENTMSAFRLAVEMKADAIELDVHLSCDGHVVVTHDFTLNRCGGSTGYVKDKSLKELRGLDFGGWFKPEFQGERIPVLEQVMDLIIKTPLFLNIELKANPDLYNEGLEKKVIDIIKSYSMEDRVIISSFNHYCLAEVKRLEPAIKTGILYSEVIYKPWDYVKSFNADAIHPYHKSLLKDTVSGCEKNNIMSNVWTVDMPEDINRVIDLGVTGIITNMPDVALKILKSRGYAR